VLQKFLEVLLVGDHIEDARLIGQTLQDYHAGIAVHTVYDGVAALDILFGTGDYVDNGSFTPQLILLDLSLPKPRVSGLQLLRVIRSYTRTRVIPVVILSATAEERKVIDSYRLGVNSYLVKPPEPERLRELIADLAAYWINVHMPQPPDTLSANGENGVSSQDDGLKNPER
jgi:two-component system, response regulator